MTIPLLMELIDQVFLVSSLSFFNMCSLSFCVEPFVDLPTYKKISDRERLVHSISFVLRYYARINTMAETSVTSIRPLHEEKGTR